MRLRSLLLNIVSLAVILAVPGLTRIFCRGATVRHSGVAAGPCRRRRRSNRPSGLAEGARALPAEGERRRGQESLLLRHGRDASRGFGRRFYVICEANRTFRAVPSGHGSGRNVAGVEFRERNSLRQELQQCDGFQADDRRPICDGRDQDLVQRLLSFSGKIRRVQPLVRAVRWRGRYRKCQAPRHRRTSGRRVADRVSAKGSGKSVR